MKFTKEAENKWVDESGKSYTDDEIDALRQPKPERLPSPDSRYNAPQSYDMSQEDKDYLKNALVTVGSVGGAMLFPEVSIPAILAAGAGGMGGSVTGDFVTGQKPEAADTAINGLLSAGGEGLARGVGKMAEAAYMSKPGQKFIKPVVDTAAKGIGYIGEKLTGTPSVATETYLKRAPEVRQQFKDAGKDIDVMASKMKTELNDALSNKIRELNKQIEDATIKGGPEGFIDIAPMKKALENHLNYLQTFKTEPINENAVRQIKDTLNRINKMAPEGKMNLVQLYDIKKQLGDAAKSLYKDAPDLFMNLDSVAAKTAGASSEAASKARGILRDVAPEVSAADKKLSQIRQAEGKMSKKSMLDPNKPAGPLITAGANPRSQTALQLRSLYQNADLDMSRKLENLVAAKYLGNPQFVPYDVASRPVLRSALMGGAGYLAADQQGVNPLYGLGIGSLAASPQALRMGLLGTRGLLQAAPRAAIQGAIRKAK